MGRKKEVNPTDKQMLVYEFIRAYLKKHGVSPSYQVMSKALGLKARSNVHRMVKELEKKGMVSRRPKKFYSVRMVNVDRSFDEVVLL